MNPLSRIHSSWDPIKSLLNRDELVKLNSEIIPNQISYPDREDIFRVFSLPMNKVDVVILGQDPYHGKGQANGRSFAVNRKIPIPPSLSIIRKEVLEEGRFNTTWGANTLLMEEEEWKTLDHWEQQGVFLLNTALTVESGKAGSHLKYWEYFSEKVVRNLSQIRPCIWFLWGAKAKKYLPYINNSFIVDKYTESTIRDIPMLPDSNYVFTASHPASEAYKKDAGFYGCNHFKFANIILKKKFNININW